MVNLVDYNLERGSWAPWGCKLESYIRRTSHALSGEGKGAGVVCLTALSAGPPVNVAMAIEVASIDHISEANMVKYPAPVFPYSVGRTFSTGTVIPDSKRPS